MQTKRENRGGKREGSGRKRTPESYSAEKVKELNDRIDKYAKERGLHIDEVALELVYDESKTASARMKAYETIKKYSSIQPKEGGEADKELGPSLYLPEQDKGPDLKAVK